MARQESLLTRSRADCMVRCKMTQGRVTEVSCLLDFAISLDRLSLAMGKQSLQKMGFSWASWTSRMAKSIVVRFVVRKGNLMKNMEERLMASGHPVSWWTVHRYLTNVAEVKATQNHVFSQNNGSPETPDAEVCSVEA